MSDNDSSDVELESVDYSSSEVEASDNEAEMSDSDAEMSDSDAEMSDSDAEMSDEDNSDAEVESSDKNVKLSNQKKKKSEVKSSTTADTVRDLRELADRFKAALSQIGNVGDVKSIYIVKGVAKFHSVISTCTDQFLPKLMGLLHLPESKDPNKVVLPSPKNRTWKSVRSVVKSYLAALIQLLSNVASIELKEKALKRIHEIVVFYACFADLSKVAMWKLIAIWSSEEETIRVIALRCIIRLVLHIPEKQVEPSFKRMFAAYCNNCKFTTIKSLPHINYMRNSLVEVMALKPYLAYRRVSADKKILAGKLYECLYGHKNPREKKEKKEEKRGGGKKRKKEKQENIPSVYNWQSLHSLALWMQLIGRLKSYELMQKDLRHHIATLVYAMIQVNPSVQYYPLRFFCIRLLIQLYEAFDGELFIPIFDTITSILYRCPLLLKNQKQSSMKTCNFDVSLRMSKTETREKVYLDGVMEQIFELSLQYACCLRTSIAYSGLITKAIDSIKKFIKKCRVRSYTVRMKTLVQKLLEESEHVRKVLSRAGRLDLRDRAQIDAAELRLKQESSPLAVYFDQWKKKNLEKKEMLFADKESIEKKTETRSLKERGPKTATAEEMELFPELFKPFDSDEDEKSANDDDDDKSDDDKSDTSEEDSNESIKDNSDEDNDLADDSEDDGSENSIDEEAVEFEDSSDDDEEDSAPKKKKMKFLRTVLLTEVI